MNETKFFEIRDRGTFIPSAATRYRVAATTETAVRDHRLITIAGWSFDYPPVVLVHLASSKASIDPYDWGVARTMCVAHKHIIENWDALVSGQLLDVQFILGETKLPTRSQL